MRKRRSGAGSTFLSQNNIKLGLIYSVVVEEGTSNRETGRTTDKRETTKTPSVLNFTSFLSTKLKGEGVEFGILERDWVVRIILLFGHGTTACLDHLAGKLNHVISMNQEGYNLSVRVLDIKNSGYIDTAGLEHTSKLLEWVPGCLWVVQVVVIRRCAGLWTE